MISFYARTPHKSTQYRENFSRHSYCQHSICKGRANASLVSLIFRLQWRYVYTLEIHKCKKKSNGSVRSIEIKTRTRGRPWTSNENTALISSISRITKLEIEI